MYRFLHITCHNIRAISQFLRNKSTGSCSVCCCSPLLTRKMATCKTKGTSNAASQPSCSDVTQWVKRVCSFSSQYNNSSWSANSVIGQPKVYPKYGDLHGAWAQSDCTDDQFIEIEYEETIYIEEIFIYETLNAGAVVKVSIKDPHGQWDVIWSTDGPQQITESRIFSPALKVRNYSSNQVRLDVDCSAANTWCEIDAVQIKGKHHLIEPPPITDLANDLASLVNNADFSDVTFSVAGKTMFGHKAILTARSQYFRSMFSGGMKESLRGTASQVITIPDVSYDGFLLMLTYLYTNSFGEAVDANKMTELMRVADRFSEEGLGKLANYHLTMGLSVDNVVDLYCDSFRTLPVLDDVRQECINFMGKHLSTVSKTKSFINLPQANMLDIIQETTANLKLS